MERSRSVLADGNYGDFNFVQIRSKNTSFNAYNLGYRVSLSSFHEGRIEHPVLKLAEIRAKNATKTVPLPSRSISDTCRFPYFGKRLFLPREHAVSL